MRAGVRIEGVAAKGKGWEKREEEREEERREGGREEGGREGGREEGRRVNYPVHISDCGQIIHSHGNAPCHPYHTMCVQFVIITLYEEMCGV